jgi:hypothetical protein
LALFAAFLHLSGFFSAAGEYVARDMQLALVSFHILRSARILGTSRLVAIILEPCLLLV